MTRRLFVLTPLLLLTTMALPRAAATDSLIVVGVAVDSTGKRLAGLTVRLVASNNLLGLLAEDRTSATGVFNLYAANLSGPVGELKVVYEADDAVAKPLKVVVGASQNQIYDVRPGDLIVMPLAALAMSAPGGTGRAGGTPVGRGGSAPTEAVALGHYLAAVETQDALMAAGLKDQAQATRSLQATADKLRVVAPGFAVRTDGVLEPAAESRLRNLDLRTIDRGAATRVLSGRGGGGQ